MYPESIGVTSSSLNIALNWVWLAVALCGLLWLAFQDLRRTRRGNRWRGLRRLLAVVLAAFALFPAVSTSDDLLSYSLLSAPLRQGGFGSQTPEDPAESTAKVQLARLLETLEHIQTAAICALVFFLVWFSYIFVFRPQPRFCSVECLSGRSPPSA